MYDILSKTIIYGSQFPAALRLKDSYVTTYRLRDFRNVLFILLLQGLCDCD